MDPLNQKFLKLMRAAEWSQAETARRLELTTGGVSQIVNGITRPSQQTLRLFKLTLSIENPDALAAVENEGDSSERNRIAGVQSLDQSEGRMKYPSTEDGGGVNMKDKLLQKAKDELDQIAKSDPNLLRDISSVIATYHRTLPRKKIHGLSSKATSSAKDMAGVAASMVGHPDPSSSLKPGAAAPSAQTHKPSPGAAPRPKKKP